MLKLGKEKYSTRGMDKKYVKKAQRKIVVFLKVIGAEEDVNLEAG